MLATIAGLGRQDIQEPNRPNADQLDLLDALPPLALNLDRAPDELLDHLFDLTQLTVQVHHASNEATLKATLPADDVFDVVEIGHSTEEPMPIQAADCGKSAGQSLCILYVPPVRLERTLDGF